MSPLSQTPAHSPTIPATDATVFMVKISGRWRVKVVNNRTGQAVWSEQDYATREEAQAQFDQAMDDWGIEHSRVQ